MSIRQPLTNEKFNNQFQNLFSLVNHAIALIHSEVRAGKEVGDKSVAQILEQLTSQKEIQDVKDD